MKLADIIFEKSDSVYKALDAGIPENTNVHIFAKAVASFLKNEYGSHNAKPFMETLHKELGMNENLEEDFSKFEKEAKALEAELEDTYNRPRISVSMGQYSGKDRGYGKVTIFDNESLPPAEWKNMKNLLQAKGFEITQDSNYYDEDEDRRWYPHFKFEFDVNEAI